MHDVERCRLSGKSCTPHVHKGQEGEEVTPTSPRQLPVVLAAHTPVQWKSLSDLEFFFLLLVGAGLAAFLWWRIWGAYRYGTATYRSWEFTQEGSPLAFWFHTLSNLLVGVCLSTVLVLAVIDRVFGTNLMP
jgi:hypothetical protein